MVLVRGLDRLAGSAIEGMGDDLWARHAAEIQRRFKGDEPGQEHHPDTLAAMRGEAPAFMGAGCMYPGAHAGIPPRSIPRLSFKAFCAQFADGTRSTEAMRQHKQAAAQAPSVAPPPSAAASATPAPEAATPVALAGTGTMEELGRAWAGANHTAEQQRRLSRVAFYLCREGEPQ